MEVYNE
jgi:centromeric protein E